MAGVTGIVLAAGMSTRMGRAKQTLPLGDTTLLGHVVREAERSSLDRVIVVMGAHAESVATGTPVVRAELVLNPAYAAGPATSLRAGLAAAAGGGAVMLLLGDLPGVDASLIDTVRDEWERGGPFAIVARYTDGIGHPIVFSSAAVCELQRMDGDKPAWQLLQENRDRVGEARIDRPLPVDVNTWDDYVAVRDLA
jgi:molybdenum cofactor cytidylyltransferase